MLEELIDRFGDPPRKGAAASDDRAAEGESTCGLCDFR